MEEEVDARGKVSKKTNNGRRRRKGKVSTRRKSHEKLVEKGEGRRTGWKVELEWVGGGGVEEQPDKERLLRDKERESTKLNIAGRVLKVRGVGIKGKVCVWGGRGGRGKVGGVKNVIYGETKTRERKG